MSPSFFDNKRYWVHELDGINSNIPKIRISIADLLQSKEKGFKTKDGFQPIPSAELESFAQKFSPEMHSKIKIPIVMLQKGDHFVTSGDKYSIWAIEYLLGHDKSLDNFILSISDYQPKYTYYYSYQVNRLRRTYPTIIQLVFSMST